MSLIFILQHVPFFFSLLRKVKYML